MKVTVIGVGRVGLPMCLVLNKAGHDVFAYDNRIEALEPLVNRKATFAEAGLDYLLKSHTVKPSLTLEKSDAYIITVGTPVDQHFIPDTSAVEDIVWRLFTCGYMQDSLLILRSTIPVGFTDNIVERALVDCNMVLGMDYRIAYCPERIAEGVAVQEALSHPQIIGTESEFDQSFFVAAQLFSYVQCLSMTYKEAEFSKLATNTYRYMHFAVANYLEMASINHGVDFISLRDRMMLGYPRLSHLPKPGFVGGTCLRKDFAMLGVPGDMAYAAYMLNEQYPRWVAQRFVSRGDKVAIIGAGFKDNSDDLRDSLTDTLYREVSRLSGEEPTVCDLALEPYQLYTFTSGLTFMNSGLQDVVEQAPDVIIFGNSQSAYNQEITDSKVLYTNALLVDPFGTLDSLSLDLRV
jgi:UDP-N-acetyl-D-mannosaminuronic acid dehydrogenase